MNRGHHHHHHHHQNHYHHHHHQTWYSNLIHQSLFPHVRSVGTFFLDRVFLKDRCQGSPQSVQLGSSAQKIQQKLRVAPNQPWGFAAFFSLKHHKKQGGKLCQWACWPYIQIPEIPNRIEAAQKNSWSENIWWLKTAMIKHWGTNWNKYMEYVTYGFM